MKIIIWNFIYIRYVCSFCLIIFVHCINKWTNKVKFQRLPPPDRGVESHDPPLGRNCPTVWRPVWGCSRFTKTNVSSPSLHIRHHYTGRDKETLRWIKELVSRLLFDWIINVIDDIQSVPPYMTLLFLLITCKEGDQFPSVTSTPSSTIKRLSEIWCAYFHAPLIVLPLSGYSWLVLSHSSKLDLRHLSPLL